MPHIEGFFVLIYILNILIATFLLASNSELLDDLDILALYAYILKFPALKNFCMFTQST